MIAIVGLLSLSLLLGASANPDTYVGAFRKHHINAVQFGRETHSFPTKDYEGRDAANEIQFIEPANIKFALSATYAINSISPAVIRNGDVVNVTFYSDKPSSNDWIGAYSPEEVSVTTTVPVKYGYCNDALTSYLTTGHGYLTFNMTNLRAGIKFYYFTNGTKYPIMVNSSYTIVTFEDVNEPVHPRVTATGDYNKLQLTWSSNTSTTPMLKWGTAKGNYNVQALGTVSRIEKSELCGAPATTIGWRDMGDINTAYFEGVAALANTPIYYIFGDDATNTWSKEYKLYLPPVPGTNPPTRPTTVVLFDDLGRGSTDMTYTWYEYGRPAMLTTMAVGAEIAAGKIDAIYHGGDISYAVGYMAVWDFFFDMLTPMAGSVVYLSTVGNHESDWPSTSSYYTGKDSGGECSVATMKLLPMPEPAVIQKPWWSYDVGMIHFVGMSTEHNYTTGSEQYYWIENDLKNVNRSKTPWVVFGGHRPMYINSNYTGPVASDLVVMDNLIHHLEPLLWKYRVNVAFWGHNHVYQRFGAVLNKKSIQKSTQFTDADGNDSAMQHNPQATVHFVVGTGGASFTKNAVYPYPEWCEKVFYQYGYVKMSAVNASYLEWWWIDNGDNKVYDHVVLTQPDPYADWVITDDTDTTSDGSSSDDALSVIAIVAIVAFFAAAGFFAFSFRRLSAIESEREARKGMVTVDKTPLINPESPADAL